MKRTLRVVSRGVPTRTPAPSRWTWGTGPNQRAAGAGTRALAATACRRRCPPCAGFGRRRRRPTSGTGAPPVAAPTPAPVAIPASAPIAAAPAAATPAAAPAPRRPIAPTPAAKSGEELVREKVLQIVAEKTGYPPDMLDMDLDLEADLGVDTVKQAETFAAVREAYDIPRQDNLRLRDFPTLKHVVGFVLTNRPDLKAAVSAPATAAVTALPAAAVPPPTAGAAVPAPSRCPGRTPCARRCCRSSPRRPGIRRTCSTWISISKRISGSTP